MSTFMTIYWIILGLWFFGGIAFFSYLKQETLVKKIRGTQEKTKTALKETKNWWKENKAGFGLLAPFLIPIIVTLLCLIFG